MAAANIRLKTLLQQGKPAFSTFIALKGMRTAQIVGHTGLDAVIIDREHGNIDDSDMHDMVSAVRNAGASPIVRVRGPDGPLIKRALDTGAHGLLVPMVNTADEARSVVASAKFPPIGFRGQGSAFPCFELGLETPAEYVAKANDSVLTMIQIESVAGLNNIEEICQVNGIDLIFIGPNDLSLALLGYVPPKRSEKIFIDAIETIRATATKHGKKVGILVTNGVEAREAKGFDLIAIGTDIRALQAWFAAQLQDARS
ncbi:Phosphoenolpyruvate/pyruvate domain-containing protein [Karstenula rhodostoma CBS 690.94]|uniref:Phosphoenolpyruvate/pyruvate domain-containing protein n=1 Tax=Karstenula rhodostoma CBS 690.94 TaxID=1392251 RepID=A0A9P4PCT7_9PLEO|nr:Phosphoenolpyruvate/pyruvate domain-containing protein [Karstenula rhodostoma CBS 690.94]